MKISKGVSPLIASVLLIAFTVAIATMIMGWFSTMTKDTTTQVTNKTNEAVGCSSAQISIDSVYLTTGTNNNAKIVVKNTGYTTLAINSVQIYNVTGDNFSTGFSQITGVGKGDLRTITITNVSMPACSDFSKAIVTTNCGGITDTFEGAPRCS